MKKHFKRICVGIVLAAISIGTITMAASSVRIVINNKELIPTDVNGNRVDPIIVDGTTYLPVRAVANALGQAVYWDGETSTVYLGNCDGKLPYPTVKLADLRNIGNGWGRSNDLTDNYGNYHSNALECWGNYTGQYILDGKYSRLRGTLYVAEGEGTDRTGGLVITADGKDIYTSPAITKFSRLINIDVSIKGCNVLEITRTGDHFNLYLGDAGLYQ